MMELYIFLLIKELSKLHLVFLARVLAHLVIYIFPFMIHTSITISLTTKTFCTYPL